MTTYIATRPGRYVIDGVPDAARIAGPGQAIALVDSNGFKQDWRNRVTGYKMVVSEDGATYDSFVQRDGGRDWVLYRHRPMSDSAKAGLAAEVAAGEMVLEA